MPYDIMRYRLARELTYSQTVALHQPLVHGVDLDAQTRCAHYRSVLDIIAIRMRCCDRYYACKDCHDALESHAIERWQPSGWDVHAVLCGVCGAELSIRDYMQCGNVCPRCAAPFNPGCRNHWNFYFEMTTEQGSED